MHALLPSALHISSIAARTSPANTAGAHLMCDWLERCCPCRAPAIYEQQVKPALEAAGCQPEMHLTKARAHATGQQGALLLQRFGNALRLGLNAMPVAILPACLSQ